ncbi:HigA family addiction module antitoxin [Oligoflexia bacterium]|nr:HigA family addiction module antitoxin [Oligoflexia bacterium]
MKYKIPVHPGEILQDELHARNISQSALARHIGVDPSKINEICRGRRGVSAEMGVKLSLALETELTFWFDLQKQWELSQVNITELKIKKIRA